MVLSTKLPEKKLKVLLRLQRGGKKIIIFLSLRSLLLCRLVFFPVAWNHGSVPFYLTPSSLRQAECLTPLSILRFALDRHGEGMQSLQFEKLLVG